MEPKSEEFNILLIAGMVLNLLTSVIMVYMQGVGALGSARLGTTEHRVLLRIAAITDRDPIEPLTVG